ncbi:XcyI family restriction endonuclease [Octadecabacter sp. R77987]|uniref:XcyI family restriction endonuclease n=1 Tax=Octadecabacter sp. R77987 TaxID=3093874 RepID=UPI00367257B0
MPKVPTQVISEQYQLRATFFANSLEKNNYVGLFEFVTNNLAAIENTLNWRKSAEFGVNGDIQKSLEEQRMSLSQHLCHPNVLLSNSRYLTYYRCISAFSQKGLKTLSGVTSVERLETGKSDCTTEQANKLARVINENLTAIYSIALPEAEKLKGLMYATAGTTIDGSWRNKIGSEGERIIRTLFLKELLSHGEIAKVTLKTGTDILGKDLNAKWLDEHTTELQSGMTTNGAVFRFRSEPDITLIAPDSKIVGGVEIKAGIDPAGALERLGAMMKSFENIRAESSEAETILVATCITEEVDQRLRGMKGVRTFLMTDVIQNRKSQGTLLMNIMRACIGLTKGYS